MSIPGANVLALAARLIRLQSIGHSRYRGQEKTPAGIVNPSYYPVVQIRASVQPVPRTMYEDLGLDLQKSYLLVYTATPLQDIKRGLPCDQLLFNGRQWNVESNTDWLSQDGWNGSLVVDVGAAPA